MNLNIHPILVHFPIAFLSLYAILEIFRFKALTKQSFYFPFKAILVSLGVMSASAAILTGKIIQSQFSDQHMVGLHEHINEAATVVFALIAFAYLLTWARQALPDTFTKSPTLSALSQSVEKLILRPLILIPLALLGLILITLGGAIGGIVAFGANIDPMTNFLYSLLVSLHLT